MTSQPDRPATDSLAMDEDGMEPQQELPSDYRADRTLDPDSASDPDLIIVAQEVTNEDPDEDDPDSDDPEMDRVDMDRVDVDHLGGHALGRHGMDTGDLTDDNVDDDAVSDGPGLAAAEVVGTTGDRTTADHVQLADLGQQWHDIQALFVDDPRGSVVLAAAAADAALSTLVATLHQRQEALAPSGSVSAEPGDTEQLREALRSYRIFCRSLTEIGQRLADPAPMAQ
jgi:hypothetical protein